jgi:glycosyltransferase involved in cell wall biosynthesis
MAIVFVLHEATRTGAPRLGALIARELAAAEPVRVVVMRDGPLTPWLHNLLGAENVRVCADGAFDVGAPFETRIERARDVLAEEGDGLVYANSLASSVFAFAARLEGRPNVLHVHEQKTDMLNLLVHQATKLEALRAADAVIVAADRIERDLAEVFAATPAHRFAFGVALDRQAVRVAAAETPGVAALNARGQAFSRGDRLVVGMCGHASARKGADVFLETALAAPQCDFLWVGAWRPEETADNLAFERFEREAPDNLYVTGSVENPYPFLRAMDLFFLSSREDPSPLVVGEALVLGVPVLAFSRTTAIADRLGRCGALCYGWPNAADAAHMLKPLTRDSLRGPEFDAVTESFAAEYDLKARVQGLRQFLADLRGGKAA